MAENIKTTVEEPDEMSDSVKSIFKKIEESYTPEQLEKLVAKCYEKNISKRINNIIEKTSEEINVQKEEN